MLWLVIKPLPEYFCRKYREENITKKDVVFSLKGNGDSNFTIILKKKYCPWSSYKSIKLLILYYITLIRSHGTRQVLNY
jgi:hypothetical protein